jgi:hypothetical protein
VREFQVVVAELLSSVHNFIIAGQVWASVLALSWRECPHRLRRMR